ncbi:adenylosuccinate synthase [Candidatus Mycoplasma mahonii]|uniref:adenylosuccinate synthase n=1 Tax=Candidatus Mycoplasma mahonii TaxID=3004105 RepID=UPI0026E9E359|nr:adenylosuccinate synthase [Candidatus Mycoplasma mahonii]WKX02403.1 adenylosuccinate synthase [Candidatus Mycoplasma mahonii]
MKYNTKVVIGTQWGDEGKGKVSDYLAQSADIVVRYQGGNNAGHSIEFSGKRYGLNHIPSGIFNPKTTNVMAQGMVINPKMLLDEITRLENGGVTNYKLIISDRAHVILPYHLDIDAQLEKIKATADVTKMIGTTKKGIGPAYEDKFGRVGIRMGEFIDPELFKEKLQDALLIKNKILKGLGLKTYEADTIFNEYVEYAKIIAPMVTETGSFLAKELEKGQSAVFEGAQGIMLCIENGTYPYVTSSSPTASAIPLGTGLNHNYINVVTGIVKAYTTRVGQGALPTEIELTDPKIAQHLRTKGNEFGTVTGRPRRVGWLDTVVLKHAVRVSGISDFTITLLDVLDELETIKICYQYELDGKIIDYIPATNKAFVRCKPIYLEMPGWQQDTTRTKSFNDLPMEARAFLNKIEELTSVQVTRFSVGPDRNQTITIK